MDRWGDRALACGCGGDRVSRHNLIRDVVHSAANDRANLATVLEKLGLLFSPAGRRLSPTRPQWETRGVGFLHHQRLQIGSKPSPILRPLPVFFFGEESRKNAFLGTASQCTKAGITFSPFNS